VKRRGEIKTRTTRRRGEKNLKRGSCEVGGEKGI
jgi:hypothetical protein